MSKPRIHWRPQTPISYPSGPGRMRTFVLRGNIVCMASNLADWSLVIKWVTCKRCLRIHTKHRVDTEQTIKMVLGRAEDPVRDTSTGAGR